MGLYGKQIQRWSNKCYLYELLTTQKQMGAIEPPSISSIMGVKANFELFSENFKWNYFKGVIRSLEGFE